MRGGRNGATEASVLQHHHGKYSCIVGGGEVSDYAVLGDTVTAAAGGEAAVETGRAETYDAVVADFHLRRELLLGQDRQ
jgi:hypothetical protein